MGATAVTAVPSVREAQGKEMKPWLYYLALAGNISLQLTGSVMSHLVATWFGPVSIVVPFFYSSTLISNMAIFGWLLGLEFFSKIMRVGTYVIVVGVVLLPVVGPTIQEDQDINELLLQHHFATIWFGVLLVAMTMTGLIVSFLDITKYKMNTRIAILLIARASSISLNLTVSRGFILEPTHDLFIFLLVLKIASGAVYTYAIVVQSTTVDQARFVPLNTTIIILINALTGIIIWQDNKVITSWYGYVCVFVLLGLGCDLLLSAPVALLTEDNPKFGVHKRASVIMGKRPTLQQDGGYQHIPEIDSIIREACDGKGTTVMDEEAASSSTLKRPKKRTNRDAWRHVAGFSSMVEQSTAKVYNQGIAAAIQATSALADTAQETVSTVGKAMAKSLENGASATVTAVSGMHKGVVATGTALSTGVTQTGKAVGKSMETTGAALSSGLIGNGVSAAATIVSTGLTNAEQTLQGATNTDNNPRTSSVARALKSKNKKGLFKKVAGRLSPSKKSKV